MLAVGACQTLRLRLANPIPARPKPRSASVPGSGTVEIRSQLIIPLPYPMPAIVGPGDATTRQLNFVLQPGRFLRLLASYLICE